MAAPATTTRTAVANTQLSAGKRILVLRAFRRMWKPLVDASQLDRQGRWMSTTQGGKPCFMFSQGDAAPAFFDHAADYKDALTPVLAGKLGMAYTSATQLLEQEKITQADFDATVPGSQTTPQWWAKDKGVWKPKSKWTINMCDFVNKSGSNVTYQRALDAQAPKKLRGPLSPARSQPPKEPGSPPPRPVKKKQAPRKRKLSLNAWLAEREEPVSPPKKVGARAASRRQ